MDDLFEIKSTLPDDFSTGDEKIRNKLLQEIMTYWLYQMVVRPILNYACPSMVAKNR